ncbi:MAG: hypothetical protein LBQ71_12565 [Hungatella sp.]|jgi:hypothetical protein|nr:hypothetical protein [Hungatella sp.]
MATKKLYAVYDNGELIGELSAQEIADRFKISSHLVSVYASSEIKAKGRYTFEVVGPLGSNIDSFSLEWTEATLKILRGEELRMKTQEAREYFRNKGLSYDDISIIDFRQLHTLVGEHLDIYREETEHAKQMNMTVKKISPKDKKFSNYGLVRGKILIDGSYFRSREGITFHENGFIGFCGEFSTVNSEPILQAFVKWCDGIADKKRRSDNQGN